MCNSGFLRVAEFVENSMVVGTLDGAAANAGCTVKIGAAVFVVAVLEIRMCWKPLLREV